MNDKIYELLDIVCRNAANAKEVASEAAQTVKANAANAAYAAGQVSTELLATAKLNIKIVELKGNVKTAMQELGQLLYATHTGNPTDSEVLLAKMQEIDALKAQIAELQGETVTTCPFCGVRAQDGDVFCRECGNPLN